MTDVHGSVSDFDFPRRSDKRASRDPFATLLGGIRRHGSQAPGIDLCGLVRQQVVPKLHEAHRNDLEAGRNAVAIRRNDLRPDCSRTILLTVSALEDEVTALGDRLLVNDHAGACGRIDALRIEGRSLECIYLDLLAPTASYIRHLWVDDLCGFAEATLAILNLQGVLRQFAAAFRAEREARDTGHRALLVSSRRQAVDIGTAMFDLLMMSEFFRRGGWESWIEPDLSSAKVAETLRDQWFDVVEVLVSRDPHLDGIASGIRAIRRASHNPSLGVIVRGQTFLEHPEFVRLVGADLASSDPRRSFIQAKQFVSLPTSRAGIR